MGLFDRTSTSTTNLTENYFLDQRAVNDASNGGIIGSGNTVDRSQDTLIANDTSYSTWVDTSNRSSNQVSNTWTGIDPGAVDLNRINAGLARDIGMYGVDLSRINAGLQRELFTSAQGAQTDTVRLLASMGQDTLRQAGGAATDIFRVGFQNSATAWENTLEAGSGLISQMLAGAQRTSDAAATVAGAAISSFQPTPNAQSDAMKWAAIAGVGLIALMLLRKA